MRWLVVAGLVALAGLTLLWAFQGRLIYFPSHDVPPAPRGVEPVSFATDDGLDLEAWFLAGAADAPTTSVIVFNGNAGNRSHRLPLGEALSRHGFSVLLVDYRGYGGNPGVPSEAGLAADARGALSFVRARVGADAGRIVYFGESLGAAVAVGLAVDEPPAALVLRSPFASLAEMAAVHYPLVPAAPMLRDRYPSLERIAGIESPLMVIVGSGDRLVPPEQSRSLFDAAPEPKRLLLIEEAGHNDLRLLAGDEMIDGIVDFLGDVIPNR